MFLLATSDLVQIVTAAFALIGTIFTGIMTYYMAKLAQGQKNAAVVLESTVSVQDKKLDGIHEAVNGNNKKLEDKIESLSKQLQESLQREASQKPKEGAP